VGGATLASGKKNARRQRAWLVFEDESGISQVPVVRRTWAPRGETPVLTHPFNWQRLSVAVALTGHSAGGDLPVQVVPRDAGFVAGRDGTLARQSPKQPLDQMGLLGHLALLRLSLLGA